VLSIIWALLQLHEQPLTLQPPSDRRPLLHVPLSETSLHELASDCMLPLTTLHAALIALCAYGGGPSARCSAADDCRDRRTATLCFALGHR